jgi:hypothetical protein
LPSQPRHPQNIGTLCAGHKTNFIVSRQCSSILLGVHVPSRAAGSRGLRNLHRKHRRNVSPNGLQSVMVRTHAFSKSRGLCAHQLPETVRYRARATVALGAVQLALPTTGRVSSENLCRTTVGLRNILQPSRGSFAVPFDFPTCAFSSSTPSPREAKPYMSQTPCSN